MTSRKHAHWAVGLPLARKLVEQHPGTQDPRVVAREREEISVARDKSVGP